jgi:hypothetical protein
MSVRVQLRKISSDDGSRLLHIVRYAARLLLSFRRVKRVQTEAYSGHVRRKRGTNAGSSCPQCSQSRNPVRSLLRCVDVRQGAPCVGGHRRPDLTRGSPSQSPACSRRTSACPLGSMPGPSSPPQSGHLAGMSLAGVPPAGLLWTALRSLVMKGSAVRVRASALPPAVPGDEESPPGIHYR